MFPRRAASLAAVAGVLIASAAAAGTAPSAADTSVGASGASVQPSSGSAPGTATAVIKTIAVGPGPEGVAINDSDDSVYVANYGSNYVSVINGRIGIVDDTITVGSAPLGVAVNQSDDTVYVANRNSDFVSVINGRTGDVDDTIPSAPDSGPHLVAVNQDDDTVYVTNRDDSTLSVINGRTNVMDGTITVGKNLLGVAVNQSDDTVYVTRREDGLVTPSEVWAIEGRTNVVDDSIAVGVVPLGVAVNQSDDTVYVTNVYSNTMSVINGRTAVVTDTIALGANPYGVAVDQTAGTVYVANYGAGYVSVIDGRASVVDDTITVGTGPLFLAVDEAGTNRGVVYVTNYTSGSVSVLAPVSPSITPALSPSGSAVSVTLDVPQVGFDVDDSTITSVLFDDTLGIGLTAGAGDTWTVTAPDGSGTVAVTVTLNGGLTASAGTFTYGSPTPPAPPVVFPPSAPGAVTAKAGDASAEVAWSASADAGSFPISTYQAVVSPGGQACLIAVPALSCTVTGLTNGTGYTASVRALNGAGWGPYSAASNAFSPQPVVTPSITITGTRGDVRGKSGIIVDGITQGFGPGAMMIPWIRFPGQTSFSAGDTRILVSQDGDFTWQRRTGKRIYLVVRNAGGTVESNRLIIQAR